MLEFRFTNELNGQNQDAAATLLIQPRLWIPGGDYPAHTEWRDKALSEIASERKRAIIAYWGSDPVGSIIYQKHPTDSGQAELRNLSIEPYARGRHVASFLLCQAEHEVVNEYPMTTTIVADTKHTNIGLISFMIKNNYHVQSVSLLNESGLAHNGALDVILAKNVHKFQ